jgi:hypothetical protein
MVQINQNEKERIIQFIEENDLDYNPVDNGISKFSLTAADGISFYVFSYNENYVIARYDKEKDKQGKPPYEYIHFKNIPQILEQLKLYDESIPKQYWEPTMNSIEVPFDINNYDNEWYSNFIKEGWRTEESINYKYIVFESDDYMPELISPFNSLHEVSSINSKEYTKVNKLYFEIHPISCKIKNESYFFKLLFNNEEILKEYINWKIFKKKGLKMFLEDTFKSMEKFKIKK